MYNISTGQKFSMNLKGDPIRNRNGTEFLQVFGIPKPDKLFKTGSPDCERFEFVHADEHPFDAALPGTDQDTLGYTLIFSKRFRNLFSILATILLKLSKTKCLIQPMDLKHAMLPDLSPSCLMIRAATRRQCSLTARS
jgi:hypothetical protein